MDLGFGLLSIRERLFALGGNLKIISAPGEGAHFYIQLPVGIEESTQITSEPPPASKVSGKPVPFDTRPQSPKVRVLLVDDHRVVREAMAAMLQRESEIEVVGQAGDGYQAIEMATDLLPDVIVMDISMPKLDGIEATRRIKEQHPQIHIVGLSLHEEADKARAMTDAGATTYLQKNAAAEFLIDTLLKL
jgi:CheY-like chemotaxis protein